MSLSANCQFILHPDKPGYKVCIQCGVEFYAPIEAPIHRMCPAAQNLWPVTDSRCIGKVSEVGPGTELKRMLAAIGIQASGACKCKQRAIAMDAAGPDWCNEHIDEIVGWLEEEAHRRKLPFVRLAAKILVKAAIRSARRKIAILAKR
jgi:hypothetical protein